MTAFVVVCIKFLWSNTSETDTSSPPYLALDEDEDDEEEEDFEDDDEWDD